MVKIRLTRGGARKHAHYRVVAMDSRRQRDGRALEFLGSYDPLSEPAAIKLDEARIAHWLGQGAELSKAVRALMRRARKQAAVELGEAQPKPERVKQSKARRAKAAAAAEAAAKTEAAKAEAAKADDAKADDAKADADEKKDAQ